MSVLDNKEEEWEIAHRRDENDWCETCQAYGLNCLGKSGYSPSQIRAVESALDRLVQAHRDMAAANIGDERLLDAIKEAKLQVQRMTNANRCICDKEYGVEDPECLACLNQWRYERYGPDIHHTECVCNMCTYGYEPHRGDY